MTLACIEGGHSLDQAIARVAAEVKSTGPRFAEEFEIGSRCEAVEMFERTRSCDSRLFSARNKLAISRNLQGDFRPPAVPMAATERALV